MDRMGESGGCTCGEGGLKMLKTEKYAVESREIAGVAVRISSYQIGDRFYCHVENVDPGATIARADGAAREDAVQLAVAKASDRLRHANQR